MPVSITHLCSALLCFGSSRELVKSFCYCSSPQEVARVVRRHVDLFIYDANFVNFIAGDYIITSLEHDKRYDVQSPRNCG